MSQRAQRRYRRVRLELPARITINAIDDYVGETVTVSPGDLAMRSDAQVVVGDAVVAAIKDLDFVEGRVARVFPGGFAMSFRLPKNRRRILTELLMVRMNGEMAAGVGDRRSSPRHNEGDKRSICRLPNGGSVLVKIVNRSVDGVAVEATRKPPIGSPIHVGRQRGVILRHTLRGFVVIFDPTETGSTATPEQRLRAV
ncbi:MAG: hypothetical protein AAGC56_07365 [Pseudomonadota bacterium]